MAVVAPGALHTGDTRGTDLGPESAMGTGTAGKQLEYC